MSTERPILYLVSRFPRLTETFVLNEWLRLASRREMRLGALVHTGEQVVHPQAAAVLPLVHFVPPLAPATLRANAALLARRPRRYLGTLRRVLRGSHGRPAGGLLAGGVVFAQGVRLAALVERLDVGHVHAHFMSHPATAAWTASRLTGRPFSLTAHANDLFRGPALLEEKVRDASFVAAISEYNRDYLRRRVREGGRIEVVRCGVDLGAFPFAERTGSRRLLCVAALEEKKGHSDLLEAVAVLAGELGDLTLRLVGDGPQRARLERESESLGLRERVVFSGALAAPAVRAALAEADVCVLASRPGPAGRMDGTPVALMEAMASGVPVVSTRISGISELVIDEVMGLLAPPGCPRQLASAISRVVRDPALAARLALAAREHVVRTFNLDLECEKLGRLFAQSLTRAEPPSRPGSP